MVIHGFLTRDRLVFDPHHTSFSSSCHPPEPPYGMSLARFRHWPLRRYRDAQPRSSTGISLLVVCSHRRAGLTSSSVPSSVPTGSARDVANSQNEGTAEGKQPTTDVSTSSGEGLTPSAGGHEGSNPLRAPAALLDGVDGAASPLFSTALPAASRAGRNGRHIQLLSTAKKPPPKSASAVAMEEFAALERKLAASAAPASVSHAAAPPPKKTAEQVAMEEFAALERKLGGVDAGPVGRTKQDGSTTRKARLTSVTRPKVSSSHLRITRDVDRETERCDCVKIRMLRTFICAWRASNPLYRDSLVPTLLVSASSCNKRGSLLLHAGSIRSCLHSYSNASFSSLLLTKTIRRMIQVPVITQDHTRTSMAARFCLASQPFFCTSYTVVRVADV